MEVETAPRGYDHVEEQKSGDFFVTEKRRIKSNSRIRNHRMETMIEKTRILVNQGCDEYCLFLSFLEQEYLQIPNSGGFRDE